MLAVSDCSFLGEMTTFEQVEVHWCGYQSTRLKSQQHIVFLIQCRSLERFIPLGVCVNF